MSLKLSVLWSALAGYSVAFFRELALSHDVRIQLIYQTASADAPYASFDLSFCNSVLQDSPEIRGQLEPAIAGFRPDAMLMISWNYRHFMQIARALRQRGVHVVSAMDNQWCGRAKQYLGIIASPFYLRPCIDTFLVPGSSQAKFARKLGYNNVLYGYAAADVDCFRNTVPIIQRERSFLFVGRLVQAKNIAGLVEAYQLYRKLVKNPWHLKVVGTGPLSAQMLGMSGLRMLGFVQPAELPAVMKAARCLVLPSLVEPWGVVIQEAAAAGLPIIASCKCGAAASYIHDGVNGYVVRPRPDEIASAMARISEASEETLNSMSQTGTEIAGLWTVSKLASSFHAHLRAHVSAVRLPGLREQASAS